MGGWTNPNPSKRSRVGEKESGTRGLRWRKGGGWGDQ